MIQQNKQKKPPPPPIQFHCGIPKFSKVEDRSTSTIPSHLFELSYDTLAATLYTPVIIFLLALFLYVFPISKAVLTGILGVHTWIHEFGHAITSWLSGFPAIPVASGLAPSFSFSLDRFSVFVFITVCLILSSLAYFSLKERKPFPAILFILLILVQITMSFIISEKIYQKILLLMGHGGELIIPTLFIVAYFYQSIHKLRWDFFRYFFMLGSFYVLIHVLLNWNNLFYSEELKDLMLKTSFSYGNLGIGVGDFTRLIKDHHMTLENILEFYKILIVICLSLILGHISFFSTKAFLKRKSG